MGRLKKTQLNQKEKLSAAESFAALAVAVVTVDGTLNDAEAIGLVFTLSRMQLFKSYSTDRLSKTIHTLIHSINQQGLGIIVNSAVESLPPELRDTAFAVCTDLILTDGVVTDAENELLADLEELLGISDEIAEMLIQSMVIKNKG